MRPPTADLAVESTLAHCELLEPLSEAQIAALADHCRMVDAARRARRCSTRTPWRTACSWWPAGGWRSAWRPRPAASSRWSRSASTRCPAGRRSWRRTSTWRRRSALEDSAVIAISADEVEDILLREPAAGYEVMKKLAGVISTRLRDIKEELIEVLES